MLVEGNIVGRINIGCQNEFKPTQWKVGRLQMKLEEEGQAHWIGKSIYDCGNHIC
jgi:hypothetical protein